MLFRVMIAMIPVGSDTVGRVGMTLAEAISAEMNELMAAYPGGYAAYCQDFGEDKRNFKRTFLNGNRIPELPKLMAHIQQAGGDVGVFFGSVTARTNAS